METVIIVEFAVKRNSHRNRRYFNQFNNIWGTVYFHRRYVQQHHYKHINKNDDIGLSLSFTSESKE